MRNTDTPEQTAADAIERWLEDIDHSQAAARAAARINRRQRITDARERAIAAR